MTDSDESNESILNVLRKAEVKRLATAEIAEELSITPRQTLNRLSKMEGDRVIRENVGGTSMWLLSETERTKIVDPEIGDWARWATHTMGISRTTALTGVVAFIGGALLVFSSLTAAIQGISIPFTDQRYLLIVGYSGIAAGGAAVMIAGVLRGSTHLMMVIAKRRIRANR